MAKKKLANRVSKPPTGARVLTLRDLKRLPPAPPETDIERLHRVNGLMELLGVTDPTHPMHEFFCGAHRQGREQRAEETRIRKEAETQLRVEKIKEEIDQVDVLDSPMSSFSSTCRSIRLSRDGQALTISGPQCCTSRMTKSGEHAIVSAYLQPWPDLRRGTRNNSA